MSLDYVFSKLIIRTILLFGGSYRNRHRTRSEREGDRCTVTRDREREIDTEQDQIEKNRDVQ